MIKSLILNDIFYVYVHIRKDTEQIFYVGKGNGMPKYNIEKAWRP